jgi:hypothetical protein
MHNQLIQGKCGISSLILLGAYKTTPALLAHVNDDGNIFLDVCRFLCLPIIRWYKRLPVG